MIKRFGRARVVPWTAERAWRVIVGEEVSPEVAEALSSRIGVGEDIFVVRIDD
jgi:hypothetical protein